MKLHLIRHGQAESSVYSKHDFDRKLSTKGIKQINKLGKFLEVKIHVSKVWCSGAARTRETLAIVRQFIPFSDITYFDELYLARLDLLLKHIWQNSGDEDLIIVGHNFGISELASYFTSTGSLRPAQRGAVHRSGDRIEMGTGEYVCIEFNCLSWEETSIYFDGLSRVNSGTIIENYRP